MVEESPIESFIAPSDTRTRSRVASDFTAAHPRNAATIGGLTISSRRPRFSWRRCVLALRTLVPTAAGRLAIVSSSGRSISSSKRGAAAKRHHGARGIAGQASLMGEEANRDTVMRMAGHYLLWSSVSV